MPIRFVCHHCGQKLTVGRRRGGSKADCPRCHQTIRVPDDPTPGAATMTASVIVMEGQAQAIEQPAPYDPALAIGGDEDFAIEPADFGFEIGVEDSGLSNAISSEARPHDTGLSDPGLGHSITASQIDTHPHVPQHDNPDLITLPRRVLYVQAGLLAAVAIVCFTLGALMGSAFLRGTDVAQAGPCKISGVVNVAEGKTTQPEEGAAVFILPEDSRNIDEQVPVDGLRPSDAAPAENHRGLLILQQMGGGYARTDKDGNYSITVPRPGKYYVLVISRSKTLKGTDLSGKKEQIARYFESVNKLLEKQLYHFTGETLVDGRKVDVSFE
ncbi:hypothetical protein [Anatilimnocola floriformis]|uniref:hypothetical protein n=1 Tax=Anatilimnocola floriformis TaxID=2948575 RepID=UPI0020C34D1F|nr:hypothetical protein [Anatilimnocola floriformis]